MLSSSILIYITSFCSLTCKNCFYVMNNDLNQCQLTLQEVINILDDLHANKVFMVAISGGDPLLHPDLLSIINEIRSRKMLPLLGLSGIGITDEFAKKIKNKIGSLQISLDGSCENINSCYRGKKTFEKILQSLEVLNNNDIEFNLASCLDQRNYEDFKNIIELFYNLGAYKVKIDFWENLGVGNVEGKELTFEQKETLRTYCYKFEIEHSLKDWICLPTYQQASTLEKLHSDNIIIMPNGDIVLSEYGRKIGHISNGSISYFYREYLKMKEVIYE